MKTAKASATRSRALEGNHISDRIESIQLIRLIAAVGIFFYHCNVIGEKGYFGVEIFNILSGFLVLYTTRRQPSRGFLIKKIIRIVPAYWLYTLLFYCIIAIKPELSLMSEPNVAHLIKSLFFIPFQTDTGSVPILVVGWTLNFEMFFYVIFYVAMKINYARRDAVCAGLMLIFIIAGRITALPYPLHYLSSPFFAEYLLGMAAYYAYEHLKQKKNTRAAVTLPVAILAYLFLFVNPIPSGMDTRILTLGIPATLFVVSTMLLFQERPIDKRLIALGNATYSFYLIECFSTSGYKWIAALIGSVPLKVVLLLVVLGISFVASLISFKIIEQGLGNRLKKAILPSRT